MCRLRIEGRFFNYHILNVHCPHEELSDAEKEAFYAKLEQKFDSGPQRHVKIVIGSVWWYGARSSPGKASTIQSQFFSDIRNIRTYRGADIHSDHKHALKLSTTHRRSTPSRCGSALRAAA
uniref:(northern house mosquito) hypothetical protein n=1 Tax=Culex pipiens TaxID=7175 RepID=A0A8D8FXD1_CULPI